MSDSNIAALSSFLSASPEEGLRKVYIDVRNIRVESHPGVAEKGNYGLEAGNGVNVW